VGELRGPFKEYEVFHSLVAGNPKAARLQTCAIDLSDPEFQMKIDMPGGLPDLTYAILRPRTQTMDTKKRVHVDLTRPKLANHCDIFPAPCRSWHRSSLALKAERSPS
jgi:hypothetical protein